MARMLEIVLPGGGSMVAIAEGYFDESNTHDQAEIMGVAGYVFDSESAKRFSDEWLAVLEDYGLSHFRSHSPADIGRVARDIIKAMTAPSP